MPTSPTGRLPLEVFVGVRPPEYWKELEASGRPPPGAALKARQVGRTWEPPDLATASIDWLDLGVHPRFVGSETASCVAALQPSVFHNDGADELDRFLAGARRRDEPALLVSTIGDVRPPKFGRSVMATDDDQVLLMGARGSIGGRRLPEGVVASVTGSASDADRDLGLRLLSRDDGLPWWALRLASHTWEGQFDAETVSPGGTIEPILVNALGEPIVGVWLPDDPELNLRWYVLPAGTDWDVIVRWLRSIAIPYYVPGALRRTRSGELVDHDLLTTAELAAKMDLERIEQDMLLARTEAERRQRVARGAADDTRFGLLYGSSDVLVDAVEESLTMAGLEVTNLDRLFGAGRSADLLASRGGRHWLVEIKSASGNTGERLLGDLERHERTWSELSRPETLNGGVLIVNHQYNLPPLDRSSSPYTRAEFLASLSHPVIPTTALFAWWRDRDDAAIINAIEGGAICHHADLTVRTGRTDQGPSSATAAPEPSPPDSPQTQADLPDSRGLLRRAMNKLLRRGE